MTSKINYLLKKENFNVYIYIYIFFLPIETFDVQMRVLSIILLSWWLYLAKEELFFSKLKTIFKSKPLVLFFITLIYFYLSIFWSSNIEDGLNITARIYKYYWLVVPILFTSMSLEQAKKAFIVLTISFTSYAVFSFLIHSGILTGFAKGTTIDNPTGIYKYTVTSYYMIFGMFFSFIYFIYTNDIKNKIIYFTGLLFSTFSFIQINGRSAKVTFFLLIVFLCIMNWKILKRIKYLFTLMIAFIVITGFIYNSDTYERFKKGVNELETFNIEKNYNGSWRERLLMLNVGIEIFKENPFFGAGGNDNIKYFHEYIDNNNLHIKKYWNLHNLHIEYLSKYGIIGYFLFLFSIFYLLYSLKTGGIYFQLALTYYGVILLSGFGDPLIYLEPHSDLYGLLFVLFAIIAYKSKDEQKAKIENNS